MNEIWVDVVGYEGLYKVSSLGGVYSVLRDRAMSLATDAYGYKIVSLSKSGTTRTFKVHRLVSQGFLPEYNTCLQVNHKDEDKTNNRVDNLEMCDNRYNCNYGSRKTILAKSIIQRNLDGSLVREWESIRSIERELGISHVGVQQCCKGFLKDSHSGKIYPVHSYKGFIWEYKD